GVVDSSEVAPQQRVALPDLLEQAAVSENFSDAGDSNLIVTIIEVTELDFGIRGEFLGFVIAAKVGDIDHKTVDANGRDRTNPRLIAIHGGELRKTSRFN